MLSTYLPFIKPSVVRSPLNNSVRAAESHGVNSVVVLVWMKYGNIIKHTN